MTSPPPTRPLGLRLSPPRLLVVVVVLSTTLSEAHPKTNTGEESALGLRCKGGPKRMKFIDIICTSTTRSRQFAQLSSNSYAEVGIKLTKDRANTDEIHRFPRPLNDQILSICSSLIQLLCRGRYQTRIHPSKLLLLRKCEHGWNSSLPCGTPWRDLVNLLNAHPTHPRVITLASVESALGLRFCTSADMDEIHWNRRPLDDKILSILTTGSR